MADEIKIEQIEPFSPDYPVEMRSLDDIGQPVAPITREQFIEQFPSGKTEMHADGGGITTLRMMTREEYAKLKASMVRRR